MKKTQVSTAFHLASSVVLAAAVVAGTEAAETGGSWYNGIYVSVSGGGQVRERAAESDVVWTDFEAGEIANLAFGYQINQYMRADVEGTMFHNDAETMSAGPGLAAPGQGEAFLRAVMFNLYFEYPIKETKFKPYFGGGVGFFRSYLNDLSNDAVQPFGFVFSGRSTEERFAYQLRAGVSYALTEHIDLWTGYRFFDGEKLDFVFHDIPLGTGGRFTAGPKDTKIHGAELGIRYTF